MPVGRHKLAMKNVDADKHKLNYFKMSLESEQIEAQDDVHNRLSFQKKSGAIFNLRPKKRSDVDITWFSEFLTVANTASSPRELLPVVRGIKGLFQKRRYAVVNDLLKSTDYDQFNEFSISAMFRASAPAKSKLKDWNYALLKAKKSLGRKNIDEDYVLRGVHFVNGN